MYAHSVCELPGRQGPSMIKGEYPTAFPLKHQHKDLRLALELADTVTLAELPLAKLSEAIYRQGVLMPQHLVLQCAVRGLAAADRHERPRLQSL